MAASDVSRFYRVERRSLWGDIGDMLVHGMLCHLERVDGKCQLKRAGPFIPPVTLPGLSRDLVVTDPIRRKLLVSGLGPIEFRPAIKARIVDLPWHTWDLSAEEPQEFPPEDGEVEDYILARPHSPTLADAMGELWEVVLTDGAIVDTDVQRAPWDYDVRVHVDTWNGAHLFWGKKPDAFYGRWTIVTDRGKEWLEEHAGEWLEFQMLLIK